MGTRTFLSIDDIAIGDTVKQVGGKLVGTVTKVYPASSKVEYAVAGRTVECYAAELEQVVSEPTIMAVAAQGERVEVEGAVVSKMQRQDGMVDYAILTYTDTPEAFDRIYTYDHAGAITYCTEQLPEQREVISDGVRQWVVETIGAAFGAEPVKYSSNAEARRAFSEVKNEGSEAMSSSISEQSTQSKVRESLSKAGHGAVQSDSFGGDGLLGFFTYPLGEAVLVGFSQYGCRFEHATMEELRPAHEARYEQALRDAGFVVDRYRGMVRASVPVVEEEEGETMSIQTTREQAYAALSKAAEQVGARAGQDPQNYRKVGRGKQARVQFVPSEFHRSLVQAMADVMGGRMTVEAAMGLLHTYEHDQERWGGEVAQAAPEVESEPTAEQGAALQAYIDAREAVEGLRDDIRFGCSFAEQDEASAKLGPARVVYAEATREAERLGVLETGRRMFR